MIVQVHFYICLDYFLFPCLSCHIHRICVECPCVVLKFQTESIKELRIDVIHINPQCKMFGHVVYKNDHSQKMSDE